MLFTVYSLFVKYVFIVLQKIRNKCKLMQLMGVLISALMGVINMAGVQLSAEVIAKFLVWYCFCQLDFFTDIFTAIAELKFNIEM